MSIFTAADILIPNLTDLSRWSCIACDQFTAQPEYWREVERITGDEPGALKLILPEALLGQVDEGRVIADINSNMRTYVNQNVFNLLPDSFVYVERELSTGAVRRGLIGKLDLECYDWRPGENKPVRATERTVEERLPPRCKLREAASLEMPHIMLFADDRRDTVMNTAHGAAGEPIYDFELMLGGGRIRGKRLCGASAEAVQAALDALGGEPVFATGDGNHSLAAAKLCWEAVKPTLTEAERERHPRRFALCELVNIHDPAMEFEPIHRVITGVDAGELTRRAREYFPGGEGGGLRIVTARGESVINTGLDLAALVESTDELLKSLGGSVDYIHGEASAIEIGKAPNAAALLLPTLDKAELFNSVARRGPYPKKSFSIGSARDKRYYLECRAL